MAMTLAEAKRAMLAKAATSGLKPSDVAKLKLAPYTAESLGSIKGLPQYLAAFEIPYFDFNGKQTKFFRVRYLEQPGGFAAMVEKPLRYAQVTGTVNEIYLPPFVNWKELAKSDRAIFITEGELKAACAVRHGFNTVGLGGVSMFSNRKRGHSILPQFKEFVWKEREAYIVFDSDAVNNPNILRAESMLCRELTDLGAHPVIVRLPALGEGKTGLDDFLEHPQGGGDAFMSLVADGQDYLPSQILHKLNEEVIFVASPNIVFNPAKEIHMRPSDFVKSHYANWRMTVATATGFSERPAGQEWLNWSHRSEVLNFTYAPGEEQVHEGKLNLWKPWPYTATRGDVSMWHKVMDHIFSDSEPRAREWFEKWVAYPMQHPGAKLKTAVMFWGGQGTGKSFVGETIMRLYGEHNSIKFGNAQLSASFNDWAEHRQFAVGEEIVIHANEKKAIAEILKTLITDTTISINRKFVNSYQLPNCMNFFLASNHANALKLEEDDRRFFIHHVKSGKMLPDLYEPFDKWSKSAKGLTALFDYFLSLDTDDFDPQAAAPHTEDRYNMISSGRSEHGTWVAELKEEPDNILKLGKAPVSYSLFTLEDLLVLFKARHDRSQVTATTMGNELAMQGFKRAYPGVIRTAMGSKRLWVIRHDDRFKRMTPSQFGEWYDEERGRGSKTTTPAPKSKPKGAKC
jgi:hypothetical protein